jgi:Ni/Co efflux regulator RcnB
MSKIVLAAALLAAASVFSTPMNSAQAQAQTQTSPTAEEPTKSKATERKARSDARKAAAAERKAKTAERKAQTKAARAAAHERQKQCGMEWKKMRTDGKVEKGMSWPKYYSACNKRLKEKTA